MHTVAQLLLEDGKPHSTRERSNFLWIIEEWTP